MVGMEQHFIQASPIKDFAAFCTLGEVLFFFMLQFFVFVSCHQLTNELNEFSKMR
jgi:hypothetical protein